ncbi:MAG: hypothetical protein AB9M53_00495 [Leptothrix sp. (in: b-proteobacteria)]
MGKRVHAVKVMLDDEELLTLYEQATAQDIDKADALRKGWLLASFGSVGLARRRAQQKRGADAELSGPDFLDTDFDPASLGSR